MKKFLMSFVLLATLLGGSTDLFGMDYVRSFFGWSGITAKKWGASKHSEMQNPLEKMALVKGRASSSSGSSFGNDSDYSDDSEPSQDSGTVLTSAKRAKKDNLFSRSNDTLITLETFAHLALFVSSKILLDHGTDFIGGTYPYYPKYSFLYEDNSSYNSFFLQMLKDIELLYAVEQINPAIVFTRAFEVMHFLSCISYCQLDEKTMTVMASLVDAYDTEKRVFSDPSLVTKSNLDLIFRVSQTFIEKLVANVKFLEIRPAFYAQKFNQSLDSEDFTEFKLLKGIIQTLRKNIERQKTETFDLNSIKQAVVCIRDREFGSNPHMK